MSSKINLDHELIRTQLAKHSSVSLPVAIKDVNTSSQYIQISSPTTVTGRQSDIDQVVKISPASLPVVGNTAPACATNPKNLYSSSGLSGVCLGNNTSSQPIPMLSSQTKYSTKMPPDPFSIFQFARMFYI